MISRIHNTDNTSMETLFIRLSYDIVSFDIEVGFTRNLLKRNSDFAKKSRLAATFL